MGVRLTFEGMDDFRQGLRHLPAELAAKAGQVVQATARQVHDEVQANYPRGKTGNLKSGVRVTLEGSAIFARGIVKSTAPHAHLFEYGTTRRQTRSGANRGVMPKGQPDELVGIRASRARKRMVEQLIAIVQEAGFIVGQS